MSHLVWGLQHGHTKELCTKCQYVPCREGYISCHIFFLLIPWHLRKITDNLSLGVAQKVLGTICSVSVATFLWAPLTGLLFPVALSQGLRRLLPPLLKTSALQIFQVPYTC
jgi:hypothetical protein